MIENITITINVKPNKPGFRIYQKNNIIIAEIPEKAENNKANQELVKQLEKNFNCKASILRGLRTRRKTVKLEGEGIKRMFYEQVGKN